MPCQVRHFNHLLMAGNHLPEIAGLFFCLLRWCLGERDVIRFARFKEVQRGHSVLNVHPQCAGRCCLGERGVLTGTAANRAKLYLVLLPIRAVIARGDFVTFHFCDYCFHVSGGR